MGCQKWLLLCAQFFSLISDGLGGVQSISMYNVMIYSLPTICSKGLKSSPCEMCPAKFAFFRLATNLGTVHPKFSWNIRLIINCDPPLISLPNLKLIYVPCAQEPSVKTTKTQIDFPLTLFLPAMGGISPYMSVTWQQQVGIGLKVLWRVLLVLWNFQLKSTTSGLTWLRFKDNELDTIVWPSQL